MQRLIYLLFLWIMKNITIQVPDSKYQFFMELLSNLDFVKVGADDMEIPEEHKRIVRQRLSDIEADPSRLVDWDEVKRTIK